MMTAILSRLASKFILRLDAAISTTRACERAKELSKNARFDSTVILGAEAKINNFRGSRDAISIGARSIINGELLTYRYGGEIRIGSYVFMGPHSKIWSSVSVNIGNHVLISHNVNIHDCDSHPLNGTLRHQQTKLILDNRGELATSSFDAADAPVQIEDDVWICFNASILKGVRIGRGAVIAAGAVVTRDVEPFTLVAGNPATFRRKLDPDT
jgi:acetyltransferase-like isoleucine patch superfamily enzyme